MRKKKLATFSLKIKYNTNSLLVQKECLNEDKTSNDMKNREKSGYCLNLINFSQNMMMEPSKKIYSAFYTKIKRNRDQYTINEFFIF